MKQKILFIVLTAMMLFAVQGYAQRESGNRRSTTERGHSARPQQRNYGTQPSRSNYRSQGQPSQRTERSQQPVRRESYRQPPARNKGYHPPQGRTGYHPAPPPPPVRHWRPQYRHHYRYSHHPYTCLFNDWYWYSWGGYHNRFIRHRHYLNRFFDSMLGYYLWGTMNAPTRLDIGNMSFTRYNNLLKIQIGNEYVYINVYEPQQRSYSIGYTTVNITTGSGWATIRFYDEYGNEAIYRL